MPTALHRFRAVAVLGLALIGCTSPGGPAWTYGPVESPSRGTGAEATADASAQPAALAEGNIAIEAFDLRFTPATVTVAAAGVYEFSLRNTGAALHDIT